MRLKVAPRDRYEIDSLIDSVALDRAAKNQRHLRDSPSITVDLSAANYLDHDILLLTGSIVTYRKLRGLATILEIPSAPKVVDFLRAWEFPKFLERIASPNPAFTLASQAILAEAGGRKPRYLSFSTEPSGEDTQLLLRTSVAITPIDLRGDVWFAAAMATDRFLSRNFLTVLRRTLGKRAAASVPGIIHEAVLNAATHPNATSAYTSCHLRRRLRDEHHDTNSRDYGEMQIAIWDDGASFADTLHLAISQNRPIITERFGEEGATFHLAIQRTHNGKERVVITDTETPLYEDHVLLSAAAFMLGVSSDIHRNASPQTDDPLEHDRVRPRRQGGVGLFLLRSAALDGFGGRINYRAGDMHMTIVAGEEPAHYTVTASVVRGDGWPVQGNLLTIDLPFETSDARRQ